MSSVVDTRYRGFRVVNLAGWGLLATLILGVYLAKTMAWGERNQIAAVETQIRQEKLRIRLLQAEVAHLEQPRRLEALSSGALGMAPIGAKQEISLDDLQRFARPKPAPEVQLVAAPNAAAPTAPARVASAGPVAAQFAGVPGNQPQVTQQ